MCSKQVIDVFGTSDREVERFVGNILTVDVQQVTAGDCAVVTNSKTPWIMPWDLREPFDLEVGQQIRIGAGSVTQHSDYVTVLEKRPVQRVASGIVHLSAGVHQLVYTAGTVSGYVDTNTATQFHVTAVNTTSSQIFADDELWGGAPTSTKIATVVSFANNLLTVTLVDVNASLGGTQGSTTDYTIQRPNRRGQPWVYTDAATLVHLEAPNVPSPSSVTGPYYWSALRSVSTNTYAYRLSVSHDWTSIKPVPTNYEFLPALTQEMALLEHRHAITTGPSTLPAAQRGLYPVYARSENVQQIKIELDRGVKSVDWIKLCGYAIHHLHHEGEVHGSDAEITEWLGLRVKEIDGTVVSNNPHANGSLCILNAGGHAYRPVGVGQAIEYYQNDPQGLHTHVFKTPDTTLRALTCEVVDKDGYRVNSARMHLWFKMCVTHG